MPLQSNISLAEPDDFDLAAGFRFGVEIGDEKVAWFTECNGLSVERSVVTHEEGGVNTHVHQLPDRIKYTNVTLKRGIAVDEGAEKLWKWFQAGLYDGKVGRQNISIILYSRDGTKAKRWNLREAYPNKWTGPSFKADSNEVAIETLEIVHHGLEMTGWTNT